MAILILGATLLVATVVLAARTSEGSWLIYFESLAECSARLRETQKQTIHTLHTDESAEIHPDAERIVAIPGQRYARAGVWS